MARQTTHFGELFSHCILCKSTNVTKGLQNEIPVSCGKCDRGEIQEMLSTKAVVSVAENL